MTGGCIKWIGVFLLVLSCAAGCVLFEDVEYDEVDTDTMAPAFDYWTSGYCPGNYTIQASQVSDNCAGISLAGCCDANGNALYCFEGKLYCQSCSGDAPSHEAAACSWSTAESAYWCTAANNGAEPTGSVPRNCPSF